MLFGLAHAIAIHIADGHDLDIRAIGNLCEVGPRHARCPKARMPQAQTRGLGPKIGGDKRCRQRRRAKGAKERPAGVRMFFHGDPPALIQRLERNIAKHHRVVVPGEAEMAARAVLARMRRIVHKLGDVTEVRIQNLGAVQFHFDGGPHHGNLLVIPLAYGMLITTQGRHHAVGRAVGLARVNLFAGALFIIVIHEATENWQWFENYLTYANSILPEALLCAWLATEETVYKETARSSFDFLLSKIFQQNMIKVISNKGWLYKQKKSVEMVIGGEQPIDVAYTILALGKFCDVFNENEYSDKMKIAFSWFLGNNHLHQIIYNPCTGGCYDGLEEDYVNLNQGAESTVSYLMARLTVEKYMQNARIICINLKNNFHSFRNDQLYSSVPEVRLQADM